MSVVVDTLALAALWEHLGERKARSWVSLLWFDSPTWWIEFEWEKLRAREPWLPAWDVPTLRDLFPRNLVPDATRVRDVLDPRLPFVEHVFAMIDGAGTLDAAVALEAAVATWLRIQRAHETVLLRSSEDHAGGHVVSDDPWDRVTVDGGVVAFGDLQPTLDRLLSSPVALVPEGAEPLFALLDEAPLILDSPCFCNPYRWVSARGLCDEGWRGWDEDLARWLARRERFGEAALAAWFYEDGPKVPDYPAWRAAVLTVLGTASDRLLEALAHDRVIASERAR